MPPLSPLPRDPFPHPPTPLARVWDLIKPRPPKVLQPRWPLKPGPLVVLALRTVQGYLAFSTHGDSNIAAEQ